MKAIRYESTSLNRIVADKSHRVIVALGDEDEPIYFEDKFVQTSLNFWSSLQAISVKTNSEDKECLLFTGHIWEMYARKLL